MSNKKTVHISDKNHDFVKDIANNNKSSIEQETNKIIKGYKLMIEAKRKEFLDKPEYKTIKNELIDLMRKFDDAPSTESSLGDLLSGRKAQLRISANKKLAQLDKMIAKDLGWESSNIGD